MTVFVVLFLSLLVWAVPILASRLVEPWRRLAVYFAVYAGVVPFGFVLTQFAAPAPFLYWWRIDDDVAYALQRRGAALSL